MLQVVDGVKSLLCFERDSSLCLLFCTLQGSIRMVIVDANSAALVSDKCCQPLEPTSSFAGVRHFAVPNCERPADDRIVLLEQIVQGLDPNSFYGFDAANCIWEISISGEAASLSLDCHVKHSLPFPVASLCFFQGSLVVGCDDGCVYRMDDAHPVLLFQIPSLVACHCFFVSPDALLVEDRMHTLWKWNGSRCERCLQMQGARQFSSPFLLGIEDNRM